MTAIVLPVYDDVDMLDVAGPMEMFGWAGIGVDLVAARTGLHRFRKAFSFEVTQSFADVADRRYDAMWTPGGDPLALAHLMYGEDRRYLDFLVAQSAAVRFTCSVCEGALLLAEAGLLDGFRATTHWSFVDCLKAYDGIRVARGHPRYVRDRSRLTGGGISAGLDEALELIRLLRGRKVAEETQRITQYYPRPPVDARLPTRSPHCPMPPRP